MLARMVWREVRTRPGIPAALTALVAVSVLLATASAGLLATIGGAADRLLDQTESPHVVQMHAGELDRAKIDEWTAGRDDVTAHQILPLLTLDGDRLHLRGVPQTDNIQQNSLMVPSAERDLLLKLDGEPLSQVEPGTVWLPVFYAIKDDLVVGDVVTVGGEVVTELRVAGFHRDPIMNTAIASSKRLAVHPDDFAAIAQHTGTAEYLIEFWLRDPAQAGAFSADYLGAGLPSLGPTVDRSTFRLLTMIGEGLVAGVVILAAVLLFAVGLLCLRLSALTAIQQDLREIGVLKAIGAPARSIRRMQLAKYGAIGAVATLLGLMGGLALMPVMSASLTAYMGPSDGLAPWIAPALTALGIFGLLLLFVATLLRRMDRIGAVEALRASGDPGSSRAPRLRLHRARRTPVGVRLGLIDALRRWRTSALLAVVFGVASFIVVIPLSAALTISSPTFIGYMGIPQTDLRIDVPAETPAERLTEMSEMLRSDAAVGHFVVHTAVRAQMPDADGVPASVFVENGEHASIPLSYAEGRAPGSDGEIALSLVAMAETGRSVGDSIEVTTGTGVHLLEIVGAYQDVTNGGRTGRAMLPVDDADVVWHVVGIALAEGASPAAEAERLGALVPEARVAQVDAYRLQTLGPVIERISGTAGLAAGVSLVLAALITVMTTRMVLASDAGQIAIRRAIGMRDAAIRSQYATQVLVVLLVAVVLGVLGAASLGESIFNLLFEGLYGGFEMLGRGTSRIEFLAAPLLNLVALPAVFALVVAGATLAACRDITNLNITKVVAQ